MREPSPGALLVTDTQIAADTQTTAIGEAVTQDTSFSPGTTLSRYVVLSIAGRGGMGQVLRAYDPRLQREVALKVVHVDARDAISSARMIREARAMAKLSHPNVVAVFDAEATPAGVVLVMEYVAGQSLRQWLGSERRTWTAIVARFLAAGEGLAAAHARDLLHRDFKPANVLVSEDGAVKVTDFGLARVVADTVVGRSGSGRASGWGDAPDDALTEAGTVLGSPRYMAPEQHRGEDLSAAVDQYAFCVALWEALTGATPFAKRELLFAKEQGPPPWPSTVAVPARIADALCRGLCADPSRRWPSMDPLLDALRAEPSRRRAAQLGFVGTFGAVGLGGVAVYAWGGERALECTGAAAELAEVWNETRRGRAQTAFQGTHRDYANAAWTRIAPRLDDYAEAWTTMHTEVCEATTLRGEQSTAMMDLRMACLHRAKVQLDATADVLAHADSDVARRANRLIDALAPLSRCADADALQAEVPAPPPQQAPMVERARAHLAASRALVSAGKYAEAKTALESAQDELAEVDYGPVATEVAVVRGDVHDMLADYDASAEALHEALRLGAKHEQWGLVSEATLALLFVVGVRQQRPEAAMQFHALAKGLVDGDVLQQVKLQHILANILSHQGEHAEAEAELRAALVLARGARREEQPDVASVVSTLRSTLGVVLSQQARDAEAEVEFRAVLALEEATLGPSHPDVATVRNGLGTSLRAQGRYAEAETEHRAALLLDEAAFGPDHPHSASARANLGNALYSQGRYEEAEAEYRASLALFARVLAPDHPRLAATRSNIGVALRGQGKHAEAEVEYRRALAAQQETLGDDHPIVAKSRNNLAGALQAQGKYADAEAEHRKALALRKQVLRPDHPYIAVSQHGLAEALLGQGQAEAAVSLAELAWTRRQRDDIVAERRGSTAFLLARALWALRTAPLTTRADRQAFGRRAKDLARRAAAELANTGDAEATTRAEVEAWLRARS